LPAPASVGRLMSSMQVSKPMTDGQLALQAPTFGHQRSAARFFWES
jgi:hypothetical protein